MVFLRCVSKENLTISNGWSMINVEKEMIGKRRSREKERAVLMKKFLEAKPAMLSFFDPIRGFVSVSVFSNC